MNVQRSEGLRAAVAPTGLILLALLAACTGSSPQTADSSPSGSPVERGASLSPAWVTKVRAMHTPEPTAHGFAVYAFTRQQAFEVVSLDSSTGRVRWRAEASPSDVASGSGMRVTVDRTKSLVIWMKPGNSYAAGQVTVTAADEASGKVKWSFGDGQLILNTAPKECQNGQALCLVGRRGAGSDSSAITLDIKTGQLLSDRPLKSAEYFREISYGLRQDHGGHLIAVDSRGRARWSRSFSKLYGGEDVTPDAQWEIDQKSGKYVGSLGYAALLEPRLRNADEWVLNERDLGATAAFDARTGTTRWVRKRATVQCGAFEFDIDHPMLCLVRGTNRLVRGKDEDDFKDLDVTLQGFDLDTGKATWEWHAGDLPEFFQAEGIVRLSDNRYVVTAKDGHVLVDLDHGPQKTDETLVGWCDGSTGLQPREDRRVSGWEDSTYRAEEWHPCDTAGATGQTPSGAPGFAGGRVEEVFAYLDQQGRVTASVVAQ